MKNPLEFIMLVIISVISVIIFFQSQVAIYINNNETDNINIINEELLITNTPTVTFTPTVVPYSINTYNTTCNYAYYKDGAEVFALNTEGEISGPVGSIAYINDLQYSIGPKTINLNCGQWEYGSNYPYGRYCKRTENSPESTKYKYSSELFHTKCCSDTNENTYYLNIYIHNPSISEYMDNTGRPAPFEGMKLDYIPLTCGKYKGYGIRL